MADEEKQATTMIDDKKKAEQYELFKMFAGGEKTVKYLFEEYLIKFNNQYKNSPFYASKFSVSIQGKKEPIATGSGTLDRMIEYLLYDEDKYLKRYIALRWKDDNDGPYRQNVGRDGRKFAAVYADAKIFRQGLGNNIIRDLTLTDAATQVLARLETLKSGGLTAVEPDITFWKDVLNGQLAAPPAPTIPVSPKGEDAMEIISESIKKSVKKCVVFTGAPGTGKTYCVEKYVEAQEGMKAFGRSEYFVQFHSSYDYTDFVEGLRPIQRDAEDAQDGKSGGMDFVRMDGIFKAFCRKVVVLNDQSKNSATQKGEPTNESTTEASPKSDKKTYYFVIDEINRADLGRVFGELMYCFEKRGEEYKIATQYANLPAWKTFKKGNVVCAERIVDDCFADGFYIPENVVIIGTMNDIDRSVETFDFALRRRFDWVEIEADRVMRSSLQAMFEASYVSKLKSMLESMDESNLQAGIESLDESTFKSTLKSIDESALKSMKDPNQDVPKIVSNIVAGIVAGIVSEIAPRIEQSDENDKKGVKDGLNGVIAKQSGLGKEFKIGPAYFKDYDFNKTPKDNLDAVWENNIEPILREYVRGRQDNGFVQGCEKALKIPEDNEQPQSENGPTAPTSQPTAGSAYTTGSEPQ